MSMSQIKMLRFPGRRYTEADIVLPEGWSMVTLTDDRIGEWIGIFDVPESVHHGMDIYRHAVLGFPDVAHERIFLAREPGGRCVATAAARWNPDTRRGGLHMVRTVPEYRGLGLGRAVSVAATAALDALGTERDELSTDEYRVPAIRLYLSLGYVPWLYEDDMFGRWQGVLGELGICSCAAADKAGEKIEIMKFKTDGEIK